MNVAPGGAKPQGAYVPDAFPAFDDHAAYAPGALTRAQAITEARYAYWILQDEYRRRDLRAVRVLMRPVTGAEADEAFSGEYEDGWIEVTTRPLNRAQRAGLTPMWRVEPKPSGAVS